MGDDSSPYERDSVSDMEETGSDPIPKTQPEPPLVFEDRLDETFPRVADIEMDEQPKTPPKTVQNAAVAKPKSMRF